MTEEKQRIAIAEARGWRNLLTDAGGALLIGTRETRINDDKILIERDHCVPDYLNDLNAIREACLWAIDNLWDADQVEDFVFQLERRSLSSTFTLGDEFDPHDAAQIIIRSNAADWCFAFLNASKLWEDEP